MIYALFICLVIVLVINYFWNKKDIVSPAFVFALSFTFSCAWAVLYSKKWELNTFHLNTFLVILGGVIWFSLICIIVKMIFTPKHGVENESVKKTELVPIKINTFIKVSCLILFISVIAISLNAVINIVGGSWSNIPAALSRYDAVNKFSNEKIGLPQIVWVSQLIVNALVYVFIYILINNYLSTKKFDFLLMLNILIGACVNLTTGGRNGFVNIILAIFAIFMLLYRKSSNNKVIVKKRTIILTIFISAIIFLIGFPFSVTLMGRKNVKNPAEYLSIYCGAEIKNLDIYLEERSNGTAKHSGRNQSFIYFNKWLGENFGYDVNYKLDLPFRSVGGHGLGNVYTTFYQYIYDYGYWGVVFCVAIMAFILQLVYEFCLKLKSKSEPSILIILYGYMFSSIVFSFFSNKFYEQNFSNILIYNIVIWTVIKYVFRYSSVIIKKIKK